VLRDLACTAGMLAFDIAPCKDTFKYQKTLMANECISSFGVNMPTSCLSSGSSSCGNIRQRCILPVRCVVFISGDDKAFRTFILPVMAAHLYCFLALNSTLVVSFASGSLVTVFPTTKLEELRFVGTLFTCTMQVSKRTSIISRRRSP
jgi:hypothetical protein